MKKHIYENCFTNEFYTTNYKLPEDQLYRGGLDKDDDMYWNTYEAMTDIYYGVVETGEDLLKVIARMIDGCYDDEDEQYYFDDVRRWAKKEYPDLTIHFPAVPFPKRKFKMDKYEEAMYCKTFKCTCEHWFGRNEPPHCGLCHVNLIHLLCKANPHILKMERL